MAAASRLEATSVIAALHEAPEEFSLVQAVRLLERAAREAEAADPRMARQTRIGQDGDPRLEPVRFAGAVGVAFPAGEIAGFTDGLPPHLTVEAMTLDGVVGALPQAYAEMAIQAERGRQPAYHAFLDMFLHRFVSHFVRGARKYRLPLAYEARETGETDNVTTALKALVGLDTPFLGGRLAVPDEMVVHHAGILSRKQMPLAALAALLSNIFETEVEIVPFVRNVIPIPLEERSRLPTRANPDGQFCRLGVDAVAGQQVVDVQGRFRIRIGPLAYDDFKSWMPDGPKVKSLADITRLAVGPDFGFDLQLSLDRTAVPSPILAGDTRLGWNGWMTSIPLAHDPDDAVFDLDAV